MICLNLINESNQQFVNDFLNRFKHTYVDERHYEMVRLNDQLYFFHQLSRLNEEDDQVVFDAVVHMQISLQIHDLVEFRFTPEYLPTETEESNQMNALLGDYHSAWFYKLLAGHGKLDTLHHFVQPVKRINQLKMELLHNQALSDEEKMDVIETIYMGLFDAYADYYSIEQYPTERKRIAYHFIFREQPFWMNRMQSERKIGEVWKERKVQLEAELINCQ